jgi:hypothetical protein
LVHLKRRVDRRVRVLLDLHLYLVVPTGLPSSPSSSPQGALAPPQVKQPYRPFNSLLERRRFGKCHSPWRILQIARAIALNYNL